MKKYIFLLLVILLTLGLSACQQATSENENTSSSQSDSEQSASLENASSTGIADEPSSQSSHDGLTAATPNVLVVYFSATGNTRLLAEYATDSLGADLYEIVPEDPYTEEDLDYYTNGRADHEQNDSGVRPAISGSVENMDEYKTIILGYPIWHGQAPRIISTFLESYDFSGKTIVPFCTSHSSGIGSSTTNLHGLCAADWDSGRRFPGETSKEEIADWLNSLGLQENAQ